MHPATVNKVKTFKKSKEETAKKSILIEIEKIYDFLCLSSKNKKIKERESI